MSYFLCIEDGETFIMEADDLKDAQEGARLYGGSAIRELTASELEQSDVDSGRFHVEG